MCELIENGFFDSSRLEPWSRCIEGVFEGEVTDENWISLTEYNLRLSGNDCVEQILDPPAHSPGPLSLWAHCHPLDREAGILRARVYFTGGGYDENALSRDLLRGFCGPNLLTVALRHTRRVARVELRAIGASASWYISCVSLPAAEESSPEEPSPEGPFRPKRSFEKRLTILEEKMDRLLKVVATELRSPKHGFDPKQHTFKKGKK